MKRNDRKIRKDLQQFSVPPYDRNKMQETIHLAKQAYKERLLSKRIGFWEFIAMQVRFIGHWVWLSQAILLFAALFFLSRFRTNTTDIQSVFLLLSSVAPVVAFVGFPEIMKSYAHNMEEIEACTRFSMRKLMGARMLILGLADLCSLTLILAASAAGDASLILRMILYLFVPFNLTCCACMTVLDHIKSRYAGYYCGAICVACMVIFCRLPWAAHYYETAATGVWIILFFISIVYLAIETARVFQSFNRVCFRDEMLSVKW
jgi:hypothetical protein